MSADLYLYMQEYESAGSAGKSDAQRESAGQRATHKRGGSSAQKRARDVSCRRVFIERERGPQKPQIAKLPLSSNCALNLVGDIKSGLAGQGKESGGGETCGVLKRMTIF